MERNPDHVVGRKGKRKNKRQETRVASIEEFRAMFAETEGYSGPTRSELDDIQRRMITIGGWTIRCHQISSSYNRNECRRYCFDMVGIDNRSRQRGFDSTRHWSVEIDDQDIVAAGGLAAAVELNLQLQIDPDTNAVFKEMIGKYERQTGVPASEYVRNMMAAMAAEFSKVGDSFAGFQAAMRKATEGFQAMVNDGKITVDRVVSFPTNRFQKIFDMEPGLRVVYLDTNGTVEAQECDSLGDLWTTVEYLIGEDLEPVTIMDGPEVLAGRPKDPTSRFFNNFMEEEPVGSSSGYEEHWVAADGVESLEIPAEYKRTTAIRVIETEGPRFRVQSSNTGFTYEVDEEGEVHDDDEFID